MYIVVVSRVSLLHLFQMGSRVHDEILNDTNYIKV